MSEIKEYILSHPYNPAEFESVKAYCRHHAPKVPCQFSSFERRYYRMQRKNPDKPKPTTQTKDVQIQGNIPHHKVDFEKIFPYLNEIGEKSKKKNEIEDNQFITINLPVFAIVLLSDLHGGGKTDYKQIKEDVEIIQSTQEMKVIMAGDNTDNFINHKLQWVQKHQPTTFDMEIMFIRWLLQSLSKSLIAFCSGNHDNWTYKISAIDLNRILLSDVKCLYDRNQIVFDLNWGEGRFKQKWMVRHKYRWSSIFNPTHGQEVMWERGDVDYDISVAGHTHIASLCRPFIKHNKIRYALLLGTYKIRDEYQKEIGFARTYGQTKGCGAFVYTPDGDMVWCTNLRIAKQLIEFYKQQYKV